MNSDCLKYHFNISAEDLKSSNIPTLTDLISKEHFLSIERKKEQLIEKAIDFVMKGEPWNIDDVKNNGKFIVKHDKTETFQFNGIQLIVFYPLFSNRTTDCCNHKDSLIFNYELLYDGD